MICVFTFKKSTGGPYKMLYLAKWKVYGQNEQVGVLLFITAL